MKGEIYDLGDYLRMVDELKGACWEEADFACECQPVELKSLSSENIIHEDYYVDFSDNATGN